MTLKQFAFAMLAGGIGIGGFIANTTLMLLTMTMPPLSFVVFLVMSWAFFWYSVIVMWRAIDGELEIWTVQELAVDAGPH